MLSPNAPDAAADDRVRGVGEPSTFQFWRWGSPLSASGAHETTAAREQQVCAGDLIMTRGAVCLCTLWYLITDCKVRFEILVAKSGLLQIVDSEVLRVAVDGTSVRRSSGYRIFTARPTPMFEFVQRFGMVGWRHRLRRLRRTSMDRCMN